MLKLKRAVAVLVVEEEHADELVADIDLGRIVLLRPPDDAQRVVCEPWRR